MMGGSNQARTPAAWSGVSATRTETNGRLWNKPPVGWLFVVLAEEF
jgi:hypothetical protein